MCQHPEAQGRLGCSHRVASAPILASAVRRRLPAITVPPFIKVANTGSVETMRDSGEQAMKARSGMVPPSIRETMARAMTARWLINASFGMPVVLIMERITTPRLVIPGRRRRDGGRGLQPGFVVRRENDGVQIQPEARQRAETKTSLGVTDRRQCDNSGSVCRQFWQARLTPSSAHAICSSMNSLRFSESTATRSPAQTLRSARDAWPLPAGSDPR
jgi:hypothetical protein